MSAPTADLADRWLAGEAVEEAQPRRRPVPSRGTKKGTTCKHGHRWTPENTHYERKANGDLVRRCRACRNERARERRQADPEYRRRRNAVNARLHRELSTKGLPAGDPRHGSLLGYNTYGCRCEACTAKIVEYHRDRKARKRREAEHAELVRRRAVSVAAVSLDERAERRFGMDRISTGSEWDDATFAEVADRVAS